MVKPVFTAAREPRFGGGLIVGKDVPPRIQRSTDWVGRNTLVLGGARMNATSRKVRGNGTSTGQAVHGGFSFVKFRPTVSPADVSTSAGLSRTSWTSRRLKRVYC